MSPPIDRHRLLGDGRTMALLDDDGTVDWWCAPRPHDDPLLWSLLDRSGGRASFVEAVASPRLAHDTIAGPTHRTELRVGARQVVVDDALLPDRQGASALVRLVRLEGAPEGDSLEVVHQLRLGGFGSDPPTWDGNRIGAGGSSWHAHVIEGASSVSGADLVTRLAVSPRGAAIVLTADPEPPRSIEDLRRALEAAGRSFADRLDACALGSAHHERLRDGLAVLHACTSRASGAVLASPTTSLPEAPGADRQFDYRYTWLRDGSLATAMAAVVGEVAAAEAYVGFLAGLGPDRILEAPLFTADGCLVPPEREISGVEGWQGSRPVRVGNAARGQLQYDAIGFVNEAISIFVREGGTMTDELWTIVARLADRAATGADDPTSGIWELREPRPLVVADVGRWMALDHAHRLAERTNRTVPALWTARREQLRDRVMGAIRPDGLLPQTYGGADGREHPDASALLAIICGMLPADDERTSRVIDCCVERLGAGPFLHRYPPGEGDGFHGQEGAFVPASWWVVTALTTVGRHDEAAARAAALDDALPRLLSEQVDPATGTSLGNAPLVWSHIEAVRALHTLAP